MQHSICASDEGSQAAPDDTNEPCEEEYVGQQLIAVAAWNGTRENAAFPPETPDRLLLRKALDTCTLVTALRAMGAASLPLSQCDADARCDERLHCFRGPSVFIVLACLVRKHAELLYLSSQATVGCPCVCVGVTGRRVTRMKSKVDRDAMLPSPPPLPTSPQPARLSLVYNGRYVTGPNTCTHNMILRIRHSLPLTGRSPPGRDNG